ncbi:succinate-semialdehyde dehydrogenase/glutarate-semialdehyde dehydrogenase [Microbacteriaceae bacterium SG_E_30_P1]|uniref:Succinate-semialdehyde dehydrogenase/glutarate-semialdehyde dehydrogenase n=1 Tax=Antiquaquibacter oligotrophicus TaxID=2880260 RepID=A0ABT6KK79_9MICO|nr:succinic semialdehyde dehydrogenase [Antiquaquibacter oligotrophicus]MDH6180412.1 succinate-semialdehyde dehydrogenase/glutarate-semialdehyde dehydrogenase [Antiquaquibacter oligotrophicus]UDF13849.1 aldehyde dehydrogenase family protein [Antiquaquibacter oligotrophicus]
MTDTAVASAYDDLTADLVATSGETVTVIAPFTGEPLVELPQSSETDVASAAEAAREAQVAWFAAGAAYRREVLLRGHDLLLERRRTLLDLNQLETGKTRAQAFEEVVQAANTARYVALTAPALLRPQRRKGVLPVVTRASVDYVPKGVIGIITPWNYPVSLAGMDVLPALAAGNAVVQKADNQAALSVLALRRAFVDAGVPEALWSVVAGPGDTVGNAVVDVSDYVCFTGSTATGRKVAERAARALHGASLELGGKNPIIVLDDADLEKAAAGVAFGAFSALGQLCVSMERVYVERGIADAFIPLLVERVKALHQGPALDYSTDVGSLTSAAQLERVEAHVSDAVSKGATVLAGGTRREDLGPFFYEPTVLTDVTPDMSCFAGETFGPVLSVYIVDDEDDAIRRANDSEYGLNASVFSRSLTRAHAVARQLDAGIVNLNEPYRAAFGSVDAPMGGMKASGLGRRNGPEGILRFVDTRTIGEATVLFQMPRTGREMEQLLPVVMTLLKTMRTLRLR